VQSLYDREPNRRQFYLIGSSARRLRARSANLLPGRSHVSLETLLDEFPGRARRGLLVCRCPEPQQLTDRVRAIPWHAL
jgi:hypothetical protein